MLPIGTCGGAGHLAVAAARLVQQRLDDPPLVLREPPDGAPQRRGTHLHHDLLLRRGLGRDRVARQLVDGDLTVALVHDAQRLALGDPGDPAVERGHVPQPGEVHPRRQPRHLHDVVDVGPLQAVARDHDPQARRRHGDQRVPGSAVAALRGTHEDVLVLVAGHDRTPALETATRTRRPRPLADRSPTAVGGHAHVLGDRHGENQVELLHGALLGAGWRHSRVVSRGAFTAIALTFHGAFAPNAIVKGPGPLTLQTHAVEPSEPKGPGPL